MTGEQEEQSSALSVKAVPINSRRDGHRYPGVKSILGRTQSL